MRDTTSESSYSMKLFNYQGQLKGGKGRRDVPESFGLDLVELQFGGKVLLKGL